MKANHPFAVLAPFFALAGFGAAAILGLIAGSDPLWLTLRAILTFLIIHWVTRLCASLIASVPSGGNHQPAISGDMQVGEEQQ